jgi:hypothetical protein
MQKRAARTATAVAVLFGSTALGLGVATPAKADSNPLLPVDSVGQFVVDGVHKKIFISDPKGGRIVATDFAGKVLGTRDKLPGVVGLALSDDSTELIAAVPGGTDAIVSIATETFTETARYPTGLQTDPTHVAVAGGKIWFGYRKVGDGNIGSIDRTGETPVVTLEMDVKHEWYYAPVLAAAPGAPNVLVAAELGISSGSFASYDVQTGSLVRTGREATGGYLRDVGVSPDGARVITSTTNVGHEVWTTADLTKVGSYATDSWPIGADIAADGSVAAAVNAGTDVYVFGPGATTAVRTFDFPDTDELTTGEDTLVHGAIGWEPGGSRLFGVSENYQDEFRLQVMTDPTKSAPTLTVKAPATAKRAKALTVSGTLTATLPLPVGTPLTVTRTDLESPKGKALRPTTLGAKNAFSFSDTPPSGGKVTYRVSFAGDATHLAASGSDTVVVERAAAKIKINNNGKVYPYGKKVSFVANLGKTYKNRVVEIWADPYGADKPRKLLKRGKVNSKGNLAAGAALTRNTTVTAVYAGDARTAPRSARSTVYAQVKVSTSVAKHYRTGKIGSTKYHYFHKRKNPVFTTTMTAAKGRAQVFELEFYFEGAWRPGGSDVFPLSSKGKSAVELIGPHVTGERMRMRSSYEKGNSGDSLNATTRGAWKYFTFTR